MSTTGSLSAEVARLREAHEAARLPCELRQREAPAGQPLVEDFGDIVDRREYLHDDPSFGSPLLPPFAALSDRQEGKLWPIYQCEQDLARIRGRAHNLAILTGTPAGVLDALANYVLGPGFTFTVQPLVVEAAPFGTAVQSTIDRFLDDNAFCGALDREAHNRSREDGEAFLALHPAPNGTVKARFLECEQITQPADPRPLEDWLGCGDEFPSCWKFGIHTPVRETDRALGDHAVYDDAGRHWGYIPAARVGHIKPNLPPTAN